MAGNTAKKQSTKTLIINAAFSFYSRPCYRDFSLSELAAKVGISKPAIYRHFQNKDAVVAEMEKTFLDLLANHLKEVEEFEKTTFRKSQDEPNIPFAKTIQFFADNPQYVNYFILQLSKRTNYEAFLSSELEKRGLTNNFSDPYFSQDLKTPCGFSKSFFSALSFLFFIKVREKVCKEKNLVPNEDFAIKLVSFIKHGLRGAAKENSLIYPQEISKARMEFLNDRCKINKNDLPMEDRIFSALAAVIKKYNMSGVTIERIADELNMAKSSLYFYFDNKNELVRKLITKELSFMEEFCRENAVEARNYSEHLYITMRSELEYLILRPSIIPISGWLMQNSTDNPFVEEEEVNNIWEKRMERPLKDIDLGFPLLPETISFWAGLIPVALITIGEKHNFSTEMFFSSLDYLFRFIQNGIQIDCKQSS